MIKNSLVIILLLLFMQPGIAQDKKIKLDEIMKKYHDYNMFDGAVLVAEEGRLIYKNAFGLAKS